MNWETPDRYLDVPNARLPYWKTGQGPDLVFVHGWPLHAQTWRHAIDALSSDYTCHALDLPGAGLSQWSDDGDFGLEALGDALASALEQLDLTSFGLVAHDSGGSIARLAAMRFPEKLRGMVLGNTEIPGHHPWRLTVGLGLMRSRAAQGMLPRIMGSGLGRRALLHDSVANAGLIAEDLAPRYLDPLLASRRRMQGALLLVQHVNVEDFDVVAKAHPEITAPVRLVWGRRDPYFPWRKAKAMLSQFGGSAEMTILEDAKLLVHEELPTPFNAAIRDHFDACFADRVPSTAR